VIKLSQGLSSSPGFSPAHPLAAGPGEGVSPYDFDTFSHADEALNLYSTEKLGLSWLGGSGALQVSNGEIVATNVWSHNNINLDPLDFHIECDVKVVGKAGGNVAPSLFIRRPVSLITTSEIRCFLRRRPTDAQNDIQLQIATYTGAGINQTSNNAVPSFSDYDAFHTCVIEAKGDVITMWAKGQESLKAILTLDATDKAADLDTGHYVGMRMDGNPTLITFDNYFIYPA